MALSKTIVFLLVLACLLNLSEAKPHGYKGSRFRLRDRRVERRAPHPGESGFKTTEVKFFFTATATSSAPQETHDSKKSAAGSQPGKCRKTDVLVLGAGVAGITAAKALSDANVTDFVIVEYNSQIGGRCRPAKFGKKADGTPYTVELGANWVQGTVTGNGPENPIWTLAKKYGVKTQETNLSSLLTYDRSGPVDFTSDFDAFDDAYSFAEEDAGTGILTNSQDRSLRAAFQLGGWNTKNDRRKMAVEWYEFDYEYAQPPDVSSQRFTTSVYNSTFVGFSDINQFSIDQRGYNTFLHGLASEFLAPNDPRLLFSTVVQNITTTPNSVTVHNTDGTCLTSRYAITTFSVGVLQSRALSFSPPLPDWKRIAIETMALGTYTKLFIQFPPDKVFWDKKVQNFLYAGGRRGYYSAWQNLDHLDFLDGSGILICTVTGDQSYAVEGQSDEVTKKEMIEVLKEMFPNATIPKPTSFMYPRWTTTPWARGSFSNWPPGFSLEGHQNLRANVGNLFFAGEATSAEYYGYLQGAYFEGKSAGGKVAECLKGYGAGKKCPGEVHYEQVELKGTTKKEEYTPVNGWTTPAFEFIEMQDK